MVLPDAIVALLAQHATEVQVEGGNSLNDYGGFCQQRPLHYWCAVPLRYTIADLTLSLVSK